jgi:hypothetical protein
MKVAGAHGPGCARLVVRPWEPGESGSLIPEAGRAGWGLTIKASLLAFGDKWDRKRCYFKKRTREVVENKESAAKNEPKQTQKQSREVL